MLYLLLIVGAVFSAMPGAAAEARSSNVGGQWELPTASQIATRAATYHRTQLTNRALTYREERPDYAYATQQAISFIAPGAACFGIGAVVSAIATALMAVQPASANAAWGMYAGGQIFQWGLGFPLLIHGLVQLSRVPPNKRM